MEGKKLNKKAIIAVVAIVVIIAIIIAIIVGGSKKDTVAETNVNESQQTETVPNDIPPVNEEESAKVEHKKGDNNYKEKTAKAFSEFCKVNNLDEYDTANKYYSAFGKYSGLGDGTAWLIKESNYPTFGENYTSEDPTVYHGPILIRAAVIDECAANQMEEKDDIAKMSRNQVEVWNDVHESLRSSETFSDIPTARDLQYHLTGLLIMNGNNKSEDDFANYSRAKNIKVTVGDKSEEYELRDTMDVQLINFDYVQQGAVKPLNVKIEVLDSYEGNEFKDIYISDIELGVDFNGSHGR